MDSIVLYSGWFQSPAPPWMLELQQSDSPPINSQNCNHRMVHPITLWQTNISNIAVEHHHVFHEVNQRTENGQLSIAGYIT